MVNTFYFELRSDKTNSKGLRPVRAVYRAEGDRERFTTGIVIHPGNWDAIKYRAVYKDRATAKAENLVFNNLMLSNEVEDVNNKLNAIKEQVSHKRNDINILCRGRRIRG